MEYKILPEGEIFAAKDKIEELLKKPHTEKDLTIAEFKKMLYKKSQKSGSKRSIEKIRKQINKEYPWREFEC